MESTLRYDVIVIGSGPAGLSAALNAAVRKKSVLLCAKYESEKLLRAERIQNVLGMPAQSGEEMLHTFQEQAKNFPISFLKQTVQTVYDMGEFIGVLVEDQRIFEAGAVVLATGIPLGKGIGQEGAFLGRGVGTCATCDASLYEKKSVGVVLEQISAWEDVELLAKVASQVEVVAPSSVKQPVELPENVSWYAGKALRFEGEERAQALIYQVKGKEHALDCDGFFVLRDYKAAEQLAPGLAMSDGHIQVDHQMATSLPGIFAAGDCTGAPYQVSKAIGEGQVAGLSAAKAVRFS